MIRRALFFAALLAALLLRADFAEPPSPDADETFARAAEALERGDAGAARTGFDELLRNYPLPAWKARVDLFRAHRALDTGDASAVAALSAVDARAIGMQGYRDAFLGAALERAGRTREARDAYLRAAREESARADRVPSALAAARLSRGRAEKRETLAALESAAGAAAADQRRDLVDARARLAGELGDDDALARAASDLIEGDPALLFDRKLPRPLLREGRRIVANLSDARKLDTAERLAAEGQTTGALETAAEIAPGALDASRQRRLRLLRARALEKLGKLDASDREARLVGTGGREGSAAALVTAENGLRRALSRRGRSRRKLQIRDLPPDVARRLASGFHEATSGDAAAETKMRGFRFEVVLWAAASDAPSALDAARRMTAIDAGATWGFEALWAPVWEKIEAKDYSGALDGVLALASVYHEVSASRRLQYWSARCYERLGKADAADELGRELPCADPADLYAKFAEAWKAGCSDTPASEPPELSGEFASVDELLRLRLFPQARREAERLPESRGRRLRLAVAAFALGDFASASASVKAAFPRIGTALEGEVPEQWRRLYYPLPAGGLVESAAKEFGVDPSLFRALVRQESTFNARARSKAGAAGLTQLMPGTARLLSRKVLKKRFRRAFLYDPAINVRLGASYLRQLLQDFGNDRLMALAAYNAGPGRIRGFLRDHPGLSADERLESLPAAETRDYVRRVFLFSESYRELYPEK